jgi:hypothetical protein
MIDPMMGPDIDLTEAEGTAIARGLLTIAHCDGSFDPREKDLIAALLPNPAVRPDPIAPDELGRALRPEAARVFLQSCYLVALADGTLSDAERAAIEGFAGPLGVPAEELTDIAQSVKEYLLEPLSKLSNVDAVVEVSKKLGV